VFLGHRDCRAPQRRLADARLSLDRQALCLLGDPLDEAFDLPERVVATDDFVLHDDMSVEPGAATVKTTGAIERGYLPIPTRGVGRTVTADHDRPIGVRTMAELERSGYTRRRVLTRGAAAAGALAIPALARPARAFAASAPVLAPRYYPLAGFTPDIDLAGKLAVITGASRGNGRAIGEALAARGVDVIGTSRNPARVPNPPAFPLVQLDVADPASVLLFAKRLAVHPTVRRHGHVDMLVNNAGRFVFGQIVPLTGADALFYLAQRELAVRTLYAGHVAVTNTMLPLLATQGYARIVFTVSIASYYSGETLPGSSFIDTYSSCKAALRAYADNLGASLQEAGSNIRVSTVNPYVMNTALAQHPNPIYTQPVNSQGLADNDPIFNGVVTAIRQLLANGQPTNRVGETYAQILSMADPVENVAVASPDEPLASAGANALIEAQIVAENGLSAVPFVG
jgi:NAD(P)-dependent dehydrogenase (short-subunit alcohol dehydrogenase family)